MEFEFNEELSDVRGLADQIFSAQSDVTHLRMVEQSGGHDAKLWKSLADSDLLGIALPEEAGGAGMGMLGLMAVLEQQGRRVASVPLWSSIAGAALPIAEFGSPEQISAWLPGLIDGSHIVTGALETGFGSDVPVRAEADGDGWRLHGEIASVPAADVAAALLVPVRLPDGGVAVVLVRTDADGLARTPLSVTSYESSAAVSFDGVSVAAGDVLPGDGAQILAWTVRRARVALASIAIGVCSEALAQTAAYTSQRVQFGRPLSTNQAVAVRAADAYLDTESIRLTTQRAAWLMDLGKEDEAEAAALVAKYWASKGGLRAVHATQHLHGGMGADVSYPIHRYFLWGRQIAFSLGSAGAIGTELGDALEKGASIGSPE
ncbi:acyl-CoA dehydrogenase [Rhodococcus sp. PAMC28707]|uniref:acyl-CoA dehydrogenase family protein n=1 Tax=unclassified Rhodococcus (in: high G+C Gram-positive bacteria) TaxID=192944 RepID=UPI00109DD440|nr:MULTISPECIES: acyl-CoA dehydrogenase family protein [unclassified Rhodococcus (in: high G+C Gram-positive bacteria)]QCB51422.1 acyl-CoA dehydrogenase [Rhodococcus sp. PAMC28705]QCB60410.1 acyl-CoA dehydrogenase [Rhodococcus sp. PAMC28707]